MLCRGNGKELKDSLEVHVDGTEGEKKAGHGGREVGRIEWQYLLWFLIST